MNLTQSTLAQQLAAQQAKEVSSVELVTEQLARAKALNPTLNAFVSFQEDSALAQAKQADQLRQDGSDAPLLGAPIAHKDLFCTQGHQTTAGSKILPILSLPTTPPWLRTWQTPERSASARPTWMSSRWAHRRKQRQRSSQKPLES